MVYRFETEFLQVVRKYSDIVLAADKAFKEERIKLDVERFFSIEQLALTENTEIAKRAISTYIDQLALEKEYYIQFHQSFIEEVRQLTNGLTHAERHKFLERCLSGLGDNHQIRMEINDGKVQATTRLLEILKIFQSGRASISNGLNEVTFTDEGTEDQLIKLQDEIDAALEKQYQLGHLQLKRQVDGQKFIKSLFDQLKGFYK